MLLCVEWAIDSAYSVTVLGLLCWPHPSAKYKALCGVSDCSPVCPVGHILKSDSPGGSTNVASVPIGAFVRQPVYMLSLLQVGFL